MEEDEDRPPDPGSILDFSDSESNTSQASITLPSRKRRPSHSLFIPSKVKTIPPIQQTSTSNDLNPNSNTQTSTLASDNTKSTDLLYPASASGPFIVIVQRTEQGKLIHPLDFGKFLFDSKNNNLGIVNGSIKPEGRYKLSIEFNTAASANGFVKKIDSLSNHKYKSFIPSFNLTRMGLVRGIPTEIPEAEIVDALNNSHGTPKVIKARRLNYKDSTDGNKIWKPSQSVVVTFEGQSLPSRVFIYYTSLPVEVYKFPTVQCFNCCRFGHTKSVCRSPPRCYFCGEGHPFDQCPKSSNNPICINCSGAHTAVSLACPELTRQRNIKHKMATDNISYFQASKLFSPAKKSFAEMTSSSAPFQSTTFLNSTSSSHRETILKPVKPNPKYTPYLDKKQLNNILTSPNGNAKSRTPNGCAINSNTSPPALPEILNNNSFIQTLITLLISILTNNNTVPSNAADYIKSLLSCLPNDFETEQNSSVEQ